MALLSSARDHFQRAVLARGKFLDARQLEVETDRREFPPELDRQRQADITQTDHANPAFLQIQHTKSPCSLPALLPQHLAAAGLA